jgi:bifunctional non-homologous end joining protein LigD
MVTGSRGIHVVVPLKRTRGVEDVLAWVRAFASDLAAERPDTLTTEFYKNKRDDRIYLDVARNGPAQTVVPPYAPRPRPGAPVATPVSWDEVEDAGLRPDAWTLKTLPARLDDLGGDPWKDINKSARALPRG